MGTQVTSLHRLVLTAAVNVAELKAQRNALKEQERLALEQWAFEPDDFRTVAEIQADFQDELARNKDALAKAEDFFWHSVKDSGLMKPQLDAIQGVAERFVSTVTDYDF